MAEDGIDIAAEQAKLLTIDAVRASDVVITMGCGDTCPHYPGKRNEDLGHRRPRPAKTWTVSDPSATRSAHGSRR